jgi:tripartite-type tricarboxylate transporter receptor subunit TctC
LLGQPLSEKLGQPFVIENRAGAAGNIATEAVVRAQPDGYTLLLVAPANAINASLYDKLNYNFIRDIAPVAGLIRFPNVVVVNPGVPVKTIPELIAYAKANPGKLNMASSGNGSTIHVSGELFKMMTGITMVHVPYRGGAPALNDVIGGHVPLAVLSVLQVMPQVEAKQLKALAVTSRERTDVWPNVPTIAESGVPGYEAELWFGIIAPAATPDAIIDKINAEVTRFIKSDAMKAKLAAQGARPIGSTRAEFTAFMRAEQDKWGKVLKEIQIKPE